MDTKVYSEEEVRKISNMDTQIFMNTLYPYRVYLDCEIIAFDTGKQLMMLEIGCRELEDAKFYITQKSAITGKKYVIKNYKDETIE